MSEPAHLTRAPLRAVPRPADDDLIIIGTEVPPLIPPGVYEAHGERANRRCLFDAAQKLRVPWVVLVPDVDAEDGHQRVTLFRYYNLKLKKAPKDGEQKTYQAARHGDLARDVMLITGLRIGRLDRISPATFCGIRCRVEVDTVKYDHRGPKHPLPEPARYSVVRRILERLAGGAPL